MYFSKTTVNPVRKKFPVALRTFFRYIFPLGVRYHKKTYFQSVSCYTRIPLQKKYTPFLCYINHCDKNKTEGGKFVVKKGTKKR